MTDRITQLEETLAHQTHLVEELNDIVAAQAKEIDMLKRQVTILIKRAAEEEAANQSGVAFTDQPPPHY